MRVIPAQEIKRRRMPESLYIARVPEQSWSRVGVIFPRDVPSLVRKERIGMRERKPAGITLRITEQNRRLVEDARR